MLKTGRRVLSVGASADGAGARMGVDYKERSTLMFPWYASYILFHSEPLASFSLKSFKCARRGFQRLFFPFSPYRPLPLFLLIASKPSGSVISIFSCGRRWGRVGEGGGGWSCSHCRERGAVRGGRQEVSGRQEVDSQPPTRTLRGRGGATSFGWGCGGITSHGDKRRAD